jgi:hypothetical protein
MVANAEYHFIATDQQKQNGLSEVEPGLNCATLVLERLFPTGLTAPMYYDPRSHSTQTDWLHIRCHHSSSCKLLPLLASHWHTGFDSIVDLFGQFCSCRAYVFVLCSFSAAQQLISSVLVFSWWSPSAALLAAVFFTICQTLCRLSFDFPFLNSCLLFGFFVSLFSLRLCSIWPLYVFCSSPHRLPNAQLPIW